jgi:hypothetical protein
MGEREINRQTRKKEELKMETQTVEKKGVVSL